MQDEEGSIILLTQEKYLPYSPTILPYVVSGLVDAKGAFLRDEEAVNRYGAEFKRDAKVVRVEPQTKTVELESGESIQYEKLLVFPG